MITDFVANVNIWFCSWRVYIRGKNIHVNFYEILIDQMPATSKFKFYL